MKNFSDNPNTPCRPRISFGNINYTAEQINALLGMIPFKADRAEVPQMEKLNDVNYIGHVPDASMLASQKQPSWALVGSLTESRPYFYYVEGFVPKGYVAGWNDVSSVLGTYNLVANKVSIYDFYLVTEYNVSHNHTHLAKVFNQEWAAIPYRSYEKQFIEAKKYKKGDCVNMPEYTLYTFRATTDMQNIPPFVEQETNAFTFDEAITITPADYRIPGIKLTFINRMDGKAYTYFFRGESAGLWTDVQSWQIIDYTANDEVYRTNLFDRFTSHEEIDGAEVTEADLKEVTAIIQAVQADKVVSFYYDPDKSSVTHFGTLDCYINETLSEFGCYISTVDGYFIARCNVRKPGKWSMIGLSSGGGGGTSPVSYNQLTERPSINNVLLTGNHTEKELGIPSFNDLEQVNRTAETAKNAVATLEGLSNATTAMETLAGQVVQSEENKQNIVANKDEADAKLSDLVSAKCQVAMWGDSTTARKVSINTKELTFSIKGEFVFLAGTKWQLISSGKELTCKLYSPGHASSLNLIVYNLSEKTIYTVPFYTLQELTQSEVVLAQIRTNYGSDEEKKFNRIEWIGGAVYVDDVIHYSETEIETNLEHLEEEVEGIKTDLNSLEEHASYINRILEYEHVEAVKSLAVGSLYLDQYVSAPDCLYDTTFHKVTDHVLDVICADDINVRIIEYDKNQKAIDFSGDYRKIEKYTVSDSAVYVRICASYQQRGFNSENKITISDYVDGDFGFYTNVSNKLDGICEHVALISDKLPNVDTIKGILDLGSDPNLFIGSTVYTKNDMIGYRSIHIQKEGEASQGSSRRKLWFNKKNKTFGTYDYNKELLEHEVLIGGFVTRYSTTGAYLGTTAQINLPFEYTVNGGSPNKSNEELLNSSYKGEKPNLGIYRYRRMFSLSEIGTYDRRVASQGMDIYNSKYLFQGNNPSASAEENYNNIYVIDLEYKNLVGGFVYKKGSHTNTINCGDKYDSSDTYPTLYVSECYYNHNCEVIRLSNNLSSYELIQTIGYIGSKYMVEFTAYDWVVDAMEGYIYCFGTKNGFTQILKFNLPMFADGDKFYTDSDVLDVIEFSGAYIYQGAKVINNQMFIPYGYGDESYPAYMKVVDLSRKIVISHIPLNGFGEPEAVALYEDGIVVVDGSSNPVYRQIKF